jgi:hypothetical protein
MGLHMNPLVAPTMLHQPRRYGQPFAGRLHGNLFPDGKLWHGQKGIFIIPLRQTAGDLRDVCSSGYCFVSVHVENELRVNSTHISHRNTLKVKRVENTRDEEDNHSEKAKHHRHTGASGPLEMQATREPR